MRGIVAYISVFFLSVALSVGAFAQSGRVQLENQILSAVQALDAGNVDGAIDICKAVIAQDQTNDAAYYYLAQSYIQKKDLNLAEENLKKATPTCCGFTAHGGTTLTFLTRHLAHKCLIDIRLSLRRT